MIESLWVRTAALERTAGELSNQLRAHELSSADLPWDEIESRGRLIDVLPSEVQARLFRAGIDVEWLSVPVPSYPATTQQAGANPLHRVASSLDQAVAASVSFIQIAREQIAADADGEPTPEPPVTPAPARQEALRRRARAQSRPRTSGPEAQSDDE